ncbi:class I SAM-dependent methyltransferase [Peribacillus saganii]|uniref:Class I SAM-dependent methyltransferase n=1 Tax=Peribacillus saganii TaxID=2303992 RepID=A0A372LLK7_9BACI|nr:class I SAM-dependent methyltransferase [Peribacillus saganii]RFU67331.1 class I SAM-dependent methyltransferase [Peribacillus saganii]
MTSAYQDALAFYEIDGAHPGGMALTKKLLQNEKINSHSRVLDAGCGTGQTSYYLAKAFSCIVYAVDNHPDMIKTAKKKFLDEELSVKVFKANLERLPFPENMFDYVIAESSTIFTLIPRTLQEYYRVLKPGGTLISVDMAAEQALSKKEKAEIIDFYQMGDVFTQHEWMNALKIAGFRSVEMIKSNSVFGEMEEGEYEEQASPEKSDPDMDEVLEAHQKLIISYGDKLGYRVFRAIKK